MIRWTIASLLLAVPTLGQSPLDADLQRARNRYAPAATAEPTETDRLAGEAAEHLRAGRTGPAVAALDRAAGAAYQSGATGRAFELSLTAAEAKRASGDHTDAARRFQHAALSNPRDPRAEAAHQTACETFARTLLGAEDATFDEYDTMLAKHAGTWPGTPTAATARLRRLELLKWRRRWEELLRRVRPVASDDPHREAKQSLLVVAHAGLLKDPKRAEAFEAIRTDLEPIVLGSPIRWPDAWLPTQRDAALVLGHAALGQGANGVGYARKMLRSAMHGQPTPPADWRRRTACVLVVAACASGDSTAATKGMRSLNDATGEHGMRLLATTRQRVAADPSNLSSEADRLLASVRALAGEGNVSTGQQANALADSGQDAEARQLYERLATERPNDRGVQVAYAKLLEASDVISDHETAHALWRKLEARSQRASDAWFAARLGRLRMLVELGRDEEAGKLLKLTRLLAPSLGGADRAAEFDAVGAILSRGH